MTPATPFLLRLLGSIAAACCFAWAAPQAFASTATYPVAHTVTNPQGPHYPCETITFLSKIDQENWLRSHEGDKAGTCPEIIVPPDVTPPAPSAPRVASPPNPPARVLVCTAPQQRSITDNNIGVTQNVMKSQVGVDARYIAFTYAWFITPDPVVNGIHYHGAGCDDPAKFGLKLSGRYTDGFGNWSSLQSAAFPYAEATN